jgi:thiamine-monophosphate kinase
LSSPAEEGHERGTTVADIGERALIERIRERMPAAPASLPVGIGDDAAVAVPDRGALQVLTTDALVEGIHFDRRFSSPSDIGYKAVAVNLSDIAAMGASPRLALLSLMLPASLSVDDLDQLIGGVVEMAAVAGLTVAGGNITRSPGPLIVDVTVTGAVRPRRVLTRAGGHSGDGLYVTGAIGAATAGLEWLRAHPGTNPGRGGMAECVARHRRPEPRVRIGMLLGRNRAATACMDLSDGLADAVRQVAAASGTGAVVEAGALPIHPGAVSWFAEAARDAIEASVAGGDDYELMFAVPRRASGRLRHVIQQSRGVALTRIGELTAEPGVHLRRDGQLVPLPSGFSHFAEGQTGVRPGSDPGRTAV